MELIDHIRETGTRSQWEQALHSWATADTGLADFGDDSYRIGLRRVLDAYLDAQLDAQAWRIVNRAIVDLLISRLYSQSGWASTPASLLTVIRAPLVITGMPRTGTTALHKLLAVDPQFQGLQHWLIGTPMVRPPASIWSRHPGFRAAAEKLKHVYVWVGGLRVAHEMVAEEVDECSRLIAQSFCHDFFGHFAPIEGYDRWFLQSDMRASYRRYADNLKLIGFAEQEKRWLLKDPLHLLHLEALLAVFPDACVIQTHREPSRALASYCSPIVVGRRSISPRAEVDARAIARREIGIWSEAIRRSMQIRARHAERFHDVSHGEFVRNPMAVVRGIYERFSLTLDPSTEREMLQWIARNPRGKHGEHRYSMSDCGLDDTAVQEQFMEYVEVFGLS